MVFSKYGEFSKLMWGKKKATNINEGQQLKKVFGTNKPVEEGKIYGSISKGTARKLNIIDTIHPGLTLSSAANEKIIQWIQKTVPGGRGIAHSNQIWLGHEIGSLIAYLGALLFIFPIGALLLRHPFFSELKEDVPEAMGLSGIGKWFGIIISGAIALLTYFRMTKWGSGSTLESGIWPQQETNGVLAWAVVNGAIIIGLFLIWHFWSNRGKGASMANYGITWKENSIKWRSIAKSVLFGFSVVALTYILATFCHWGFKLSPHFWVFTIKQFTVDDFLAFIGYLVPFTFYFLAFGILFHGEFRSSRSSETRLPLQMIKNFFIITIPYALLLLAEYIPRFMGGTLLTSSYPLWTIIAFQYIPLLGIGALASTFFFRKTGRIYPGAFVNGTLITWLIVASQATHVA